MLFNNKKNYTLDKFSEIRNKICIVRRYGGLGDIIAMRMIFEDLNEQYPEFDITWAIPNNYYAAAQKHPNVNAIENFYDSKKENYIETYNLSTVCSNYEWKFGKTNPKNRADIWAEHIGLTLTKHNIYMPSYPECFENIHQKLLRFGWDGKKPLCLLAPRSAISVKNMNEKQVSHIKKITQDKFLFILHNYPIIELDHLKIPTLSGLSMKEALSVVEYSHYVISTDTGILHAAAAYSKPTLGFFSFVDGYVYCKYYPTVQVIQKHAKYDPNWCGPCYDHSRCSVAPKSQIKPCMTELSEELIDKNWETLLNNYSV
jgi:ADP-heptose:LPS heptosyltransferase